MARRQHRLITIKKFSEAHEYNYEERMTAQGFHQPNARPQVQCNNACVIFAQFNNVWHALGDRQHLIQHLKLHMA